MTLAVLDIIFFISIAINVIIFCLYLLSKKGDEHGYEKVKSTPSSSPISSDSDQDEIDSFILEETGIPVPSFFIKKKPFKSGSPPSITTNIIQRELTQNLLTYATIASICLAIAIGISLKLYKEKWSKRSLIYLAFPGEIYLRMLESLVLPLIIAGPIAALANLDVQLTAKIGKRAIIYYLSTTILAIILGLILVLSFSPIEKGEIPGKDPREEIRTTEDILLDQIRNLFPRNLVEACFSYYSTSLEKPDNTTTNNKTDIYKWKINHKYKSGKINIIGIVFYSIIFGVIINRMQALTAYGRPLLDVFISINEMAMRTTEFVIRFTPIGVFFLVMSQIISAEDVQKFLGNIGIFCLIVIVGLLIHGLLILPAIYFVIIRKNPYHFIRQMLEAWMTAFATASSLATLPVTIRCLERSQIDKRVVRFVVPIGATINMDGFALYEAVAVIFIARSLNFEMSLAKIVIISITATAGSIGAAGMPGAAIPTMIMVLDSVGMPADAITMIVFLDWLLDRFMTAINVLGDCFGSAIVDHLIRDDLKKFKNKP